jgi:hypothetical protein
VICDLSHKDRPAYWTRTAYTKLDDMSLGFLGWATDALGREPTGVLRSQLEGPPRRAWMVAGGAIETDEATYDSYLEDGARQAGTALPNRRDPC